jgi:hypothetical protein
VIRPSRGHRVVPQLVLIQLSQPTPAHENRRVNVPGLGKNRSSAARRASRRWAGADVRRSVQKRRGQLRHRRGRPARRVRNPSCIRVPVAPRCASPITCGRPTPIPPTTRATTEPTGGRSATCSGHRSGPRRHLVHRRMRRSAARARRTRVVHDAHRRRRFPRATWLPLLENRASSTCASCRRPTTTTRSTPRVSSASTPVICRRARYPELRGRTSRRQPSSYAGSPA